MLDSCRPIGVFKTNRDAKGHVERYKARLVAKGYVEREGIDFKETFYFVSTKDSLCIIMAIVAHFDSELHHMYMRTTFLNGDLVKDVYMSQPIGFEEVGKDHMVCKLSEIHLWFKASFKAVVSQCIYMKVHIIYQCIYMKVSGSKYIFLVLYVDDILLAANDTDMLVKTKKLLFSHFDMKDLGEASHVLGIQILHDRPSIILRLS